MAHRATQGFDLGDKFGANAFDCDNCDCRYCWVSWHSPMLPSASASRVAAAPCSVSVLNMMTGSLGYSLRTAARVSKPSITGISMSSVTRSGLSCGILARAMCPSLAVATTSSAGSPDKVSESSLRITTESSTTRMRMGAISIRVYLFHKRCCQASGPQSQTLDQTAQPAKPDHLCAELRHRHGPPCSTLARPALRPLHRHWRRD